MELKFLGKNYIPTSMSFAEGFLGPRGNVGFVMKFDFKKAKSFCKSLKGIETIKAGLDGDFIENSQTIFEDGKWVEEINFYDNSIWARPIIIINFKNKPSEAFECWKKGD